MKFRKKPVVIDAEQFLPKEWEIECVEKFANYGIKTGRATGFIIPTLEGVHELTPGDWIITGVKGETYPCKPDIFEMTYEKVED